MLFTLYRITIELHARKKENTVQHPATITEQFALSLDDYTGAWQYIPDFDSPLIR